MRIALSRTPMFSSDLSGSGSYANVRAAMVCQFQSIQQSMHDSIRI